MKKTLLIAAAALAAGMISAQAQAVYSQNVVGYVNVVFPAGYTMVNVPLNTDGTNNAETVLKTLQTGDTLLTWNGGGYDISTYLDVGSWIDANGNPIAAPTLMPGKGFFYQNAQGTPQTNTFVGQVTSSNTIPLLAGYNMIGLTAPVGASIESTNISLPFQTGDTILTWNGGGYDISTYLDVGTWIDANGNPISIPNLSVGQGFFYQNAQGATESWTQNVKIQ